MQRPAPEQQHDTALYTQDTTSLPGQFIVIESLDGAGGTTQAALLTRKLKAAGRRVFQTREPTDGSVGHLVRSALRGEITLLPSTMALLFAADRNEHVHDPGHGMLAAIRTGTTVVCDRYLYSSLAYQSLECGWELVSGLNAGFPAPSDLVFLVLSMEQCAERRSDRNLQEIYEVDSFQAKVAESYETALVYAKQQGVRVHRIDGSGSAEEVAELVWNSLSSMPIQ